MKYFVENSEKKKLIKTSNYKIKFAQFYWTFLSFCCPLGYFFFANQTREEESWDCSAYYKVDLIFKAHVATYHQLFSFLLFTALSVLIDFYFILFFQVYFIFLSRLVDESVVNNFSIIFFFGEHMTILVKLLRSLKGGDGESNAINKIIVLAASFT